MRTVKLQLSVEGNEKAVLTDMCHCAKNLYNSALYIIRQEYHRTKTHFSENKTDKLMRTDNPKIYYKLNSVAAQRVIKQLAEDYKSFFGLIKAKAAGTIDFQPRPPKYKKKSGLIPVSLNDRSFRFDGDKIKISTSKYHRNKFGLRVLVLPIGNYIDTSSVKEVEIIPLGFGRFELQFKYEEKPVAKVSGTGTLSIDMGLDVLAAMTSSLGDAILVSGKQLKSINRQWNKTRAKLYSLIDTEKNFYKKLRLKETLRNIDRRRNRTVLDIMHKVSRNIVRHAEENGITTIIVGKNDGWKQGINIGAKNNQKFVQIPHAKLLELLKYKGEEKGINVVFQEESYTSKCDSLASEPIQKHENYMGRRKKRGLFLSSTGKLIHADINASMNVERKRNGNSAITSKIAAIGRVFRPRYAPPWGQLQASPKSCPRIWSQAPSSTASAVGRGN